MKRLNLRNKTFNIGFISTEPYTRVDKITHTLGDGIETQMLSTLAEYFNFSMKLIDAKGRYGSKEPNGSWNGLIGMIANNEIDFAISGSSMTYGRTEVVNYFYPFWIDTMGFATSVPRNYIPYDLLIVPFGWNTWLCFLLSFGLIICFGQLRTAVLKSWMPTENLIWTSLCTTFRQPSRNLERDPSYSTKIVTVIWMLAIGMVLSDAYSGNLCSMLAVPTKTLVNNIYELAIACRSKQIIMLCLKSTNIKEIFEQSESEHIRNIWDSVQMIDSSLEAMQTLANRSESIEQDPHDLHHHFAFMSTGERLKIWQNKLGKKNIHIPGEEHDSSFFDMLVSMPAKRSFPYFSQFNRAVSHLSAGGFLNFWRERVFFRIWMEYKYKEHEEEPDDQTVEAFSWSHLESLFHLYLLLLFISTMVFIFYEICFQSKFGQIFWQKFTIKR